MEEEFEIIEPIYPLGRLRITPIRAKLMRNNSLSNKMKASVTFEIGQYKASTETDNAGGDGTQMEKCRICILYTGL